MMILMFLNSIDILRKLAEDVKFVRPHDGEVITYIAETVSDMLRFFDSEIC